MFSMTSFPCCTHFATSLFLNAKNMWRNALLTLVAHSEISVSAIRPPSCKPSRPPLRTHQLSNQPDLPPLPAAGWETTGATLLVITYIVFHSALLISVQSVHQSGPAGYVMYTGSVKVQGTAGIPLGSISGPLVGFYIRQSTVSAILQVLPEPKN